MSFPQFIAPLDPANVPIRRCPVPRARASRRFLIVRLGSHGDILMATPLLAALRAAYPDCWLTWMVEHTQYQVLDANPFVDELVIWDGDYWKKMLSRRWKNWFGGRCVLGLRWLANAFSFRNALRDRRFDVFISFQPEEWPLLVTASGAPMSIGVFDAFRQYTGGTTTSAHVRRYTHAFTFEDLPTHRTDQYLLPLRALGLPGSRDKGMVMGFTADDAAQVNGLLAEQGIVSTDAFVVLAPMTNWESRNWPWERFVELGDALTRQGRRVVLIGSARPEEQSTVERIAAQMRVPPVTFSRLSFRQMAALIGRSSLLVSGDTGPMHVSAAVGTPYVALFGPTPTEVLAPLSGRGLSLAHPVPCGPCYRSTCANDAVDHLRCLRLISVAEVVEAAARFVPLSV